MREEETWGLKANLQMTASPIPTDCVRVDHVADSSYLTKKRKSCSVRKPRVGTTGPSPEQLRHIPLYGNQPAAEGHQLLWKQDLLKDAPCPQ